MHKRLDCGANKWLTPKLFHDDQHGERTSFRRWDDKSPPGGRTLSLSFPRSRGAWAGLFRFYKVGVFHHGIEIVHDLLPVEIFPNGNLS